MKSKRLILMIICIIILSGCNSKNNGSELDIDTPITLKETDNTKVEPTKVDNNVDETKTTNKNEAEAIQIYIPDLTTEESIIDYLQGEWFYNNFPEREVICRMNIDNDLNISLSFYNYNTDESKGDYTGRIEFDRQYANLNEAPDLINIELADTDYPGGMFFFLHRTIYDGKNVMSLFFAGNGDCIFDLLEDEENYEWSSREIIFEKFIEEISELTTREDDEFYAVYWGNDEVKSESIWLDDTWYTPSDEEEFFRKYYIPMTIYENKDPESVLYKMSRNFEVEILEDKMSKGQVYYFTTDKNGDIIKILDAQIQRDLENGFINNIDEDTKFEIFEIFTIVVEDTKQYIDDGMSVLLTGEIVTLDGEDFIVADFGRYPEGKFTREIRCAININTEQIIRYNFLTKQWEYLSVG